MRMLIFIIMKNIIKKGLLMLREKLSILLLLGCATIHAQGQFDYSDAIENAGISKSDWEKTSAFDKLKVLDSVKRNPGKKVVAPAPRKEGIMYQEPPASMPAGGVSLLQVVATQPEQRSYTRFGAMTENILEQNHGKAGLAEWKKKPLAQQNAEAQRLWSQTQTKARADAPVQQAMLFQQLPTTQPVKPAAEPKRKLTRPVVRPKTKEKMTPSGKKQ